MKVAPVAAQVPVYDRASGAMLLRWPIDAREMVRSGEYSMTPPEPAPVAEVPQDEAPQDGAPAADMPTAKRRR